jgi:signal peptidase I
MVWGHNVNRSHRRLRTVVLTGMAVLAMVAVGVLASGRASIVVTHGVSMNPIYHQGDLVMVAAAPSYQVGEIAAYRLPGQNVVVLHRIIGGNAQGFVMKGDNNQSTDVTKPTARQLVGHAVARVPKAGAWLQALTGPTALGLMTFGLIAAGATAQTQSKRKRRRARLSRHATLRSGPVLAVNALPPSMRAAAAGTAAVGVLGIALAAVAFSLPVDRPEITQTHATSHLVFSYTAMVGHTAAYDGITARAPDPIFRKLASTVDLRFHYRGAPGSIAVSAELSTPGGWHSRVSITPPTRFTGNDYQGDATLDLNAFDARAQAAAAATGLPASPLSIAVTPRVLTTGSVAFQPTLNLTLTPLQLTMTGDPSDLTATNVTTSSHKVRLARTLDLYRQRLTVAHARAAAVIAILVAMLGVALIALIALITRGTSRGDEGLTIRRRYGPLLVRVHPVATPAGRAVIDVTAFTALATLAERYGLSILHWSRSGIETFIVQDEGSIYRYRTAKLIANLVPEPTPPDTDHRVVDHALAPSNG